MPLQLGLPLKHRTQLLRFFVALEQLHERKPAKRSEGERGVNNGGRGESEKGSKCGDCPEVDHRNYKIWCL
jgi:hypothetical protein